MNVKCCLFLKQRKDDHKNDSAEVQQAMSTVIFMSQVTGALKKTRNVILMGSCHTEHGPLQGVLLKPVFQMNSLWSLLQ